MDVSVVVTAYNEERFIGRCLSSLLSQDAGFELIVVDDGSTDDTSVVVEKFAAEHPGRVKLLRLERNVGVGNARNIGAARASGRVVVFLDADMEFPPDFIRKTVNPILKGEAVATCNSTEVIGNVDNPWVKVQGQRIRGVLQAGKTGFVRAIDRQFFLAAGGFDASKGFFDDTTFHRKTGLEAAVVDVPLIHHNPDTAGEVFWRNRWIGRSVLKAHKRSEVLAMFAKRLLDLSPFIGFLLLVFPDLLLRVFGMLSLVFFIAVVKRHRVLPSHSWRESLRLRLFYVPAYRWVKALGFITGLVESLSGRGWRPYVYQVFEKKG
ncbi:MAG: glycosyltransferase family 2 protein [Candidatus Caldarchaeum sp.]